MLKKLFDRPNFYDTKRSQVDTLFLSLHALGLLTMERDRVAMRWNIAWANSETPAYIDDTKWMGVPLHPPTPARVCLPKNVPTRMIAGMQQSMYNWLGDSKVSKDKGD